MKWEELTAPDFAEAVESTGRVCVIAVGCVEKHFDHLPLGTDFLNGHKICSMAAEREPAVVFPPYYVGQIHEARPFPGTVAIDPVLTLKLLLNVFDEIGRNGFTKIIIYNAHGGNTHMLNYAIQSCLAERRPYAVYLYNGLVGKYQHAEWKELLDTPVHGHACECETSISLANHEHLVKMDYIKGRKADPLGRFNHIPPGRVTSRWFSDYPDHYAGDASAANKEKGEKLRELVVGALSQYIKAVREDAVVAEILGEFYDQCDEVGK
jgi:creatinine amidohydrolase